MPHQVVNGVLMYYEEHGAGDPIACIHGMLGSALVWGDAIDTLGRLGRLIVYDRRGCTRSERPAPYVSTSVSEQADDAAALLQTLSASPAIVIGRSYGGAVALDLAIRYPERVRALVLLDPSLIDLPCAPWPTELRELVLEAASRGIEAVAETFLRYVVGNSVWEGFPEELKQMTRDNGQALVAELSGGPLKVEPASLVGIEQPAGLTGRRNHPTRSPR